ncbi:MAG: hypothetical protein M3248_07345, partial [Actinomycetota bacterium]|nr:hypothetical protein [Actinomycetota bacterium]
SYQIGLSHTLEPTKTFNPHLYQAGSKSWTESVVGVPQKALVERALIGESRFLLKRELFRQLLSRALPNLQI